MIRNIVRNCPQTPGPLLGTHWAYQEGKLKSQAWERRHPQLGVLGAQLGVLGGQLGVLGAQLRVLGARLRILGAQCRVLGAPCLSS